MFSELEATRSPNPIFTALLQEQVLEAEARLVFGTLPAGGTLVAKVSADVVHDPLPAGDRFPFAASRTAVMPGLVTPTPTISLPVITLSKRVRP